MQDPHNATTLLKANSSSRTNTLHCITSHPRSNESAKDPDRKEKIPQLAMTNLDETDETKRPEACDGNLQRPHAAGQ